MEVTTANGYTLISLPYEETGKRKIGEKWLKTLVPLRKLYYFMLTVLGEVNIDMDARSAFKEFLKTHLETNTYDLVIVTCPPFNLLRLAHEIFTSHGIPYAVDFRDLWNNLEMKRGFRYKGLDKLFARLSKSHISKWIEDARFVTVATPAMKHFINELGYKGSVEVILNGYEEYLYSGPALHTANERFTISCVGTLYPEQDLEIFATGLKIFLERKPGAKIEVRFTGTGFFPEMVEKVKTLIPAEVLAVTGRLPRNEAIKETRSADVLYYPGWKGYDGILTTKIFDYLASRKNLLIAPGDKGAIEQLLQEVNTGTIADTAEQVSEALDKWYAEWVEKGQLDYTANENKIAGYSREHQAQRMVAVIKEKFPGTNLTASTPVS